MVGAADGSHYLQYTPPPHLRKPVHKVQALTLPTMYLTNMLAGAAAIDDETRLVLYALAQQAEHGPCKEAKPWSWNMVESAKWNAWSQLGNMAPVEAMRLYVKVIEESIQVRPPSA